MLNVQEATLLVEVWKKYCYCARFTFLDVEFRLGYKGFTANPEYCFYRTDQKWHITIGSNIVGLPLPILTIGDNPVEKTRIMFKGDRELLTQDLVLMRLCLANTE